MKKKAALTLLRLYRKHPEVIPAAEWALRIVSIMDDQDLVIGLPILADDSRSGWVNITGRSNLRNESGHGSSTRPPGRFCGVLHQSCRSVASGISTLALSIFQNLMTLYSSLLDMNTPQLMHIIRSHHLGYRSNFCVFSNITLQLVGAADLFITYRTSCRPRGSYH